MNDLRQPINRWMLYAHCVFLFFLGMFGNDFIKFELLIPSFFLVLYFLLCSAHVLYFGWINRAMLRIRNMNSLEKASLLFVAVCLLYGILSWFGVFDHSAVDDIQFDRGYIPRHMVMIGFLPIGLSMYILFLDPQTEKAILKSHKPMVILLFVLLILGYLRSPEACFLFLLLLFIEYSVANSVVEKILSILILVVYFLFSYSGGTSILLFLACALVLLAKGRLFAFLAKYKLLLGIVASVAVAVILVFHEPILAWLKVTDANIWWRLHYWMVELQVVVARWFAGVGFGTAYAPMSIRETLVGGFVDPITKITIPYQVMQIKVKVPIPFIQNYIDWLQALVKSTLFITGQHNSYVNILYRTGIVGFVLFVFVNFRLLTQGKGRTEFERLLMLAFINGTILILLNVGLESPRFLILFYIGFFGAMSLCRKHETEDTVMRKEEQ